MKGQGEGLSVVRITVRVHPRSSRVGRRWDGSQLELWIREPPVDGAANTAVVQEVARWLDITRGAVRIVTGTSSRTKIVEIDGAVSLPAPDPAS